MTDSPANDADLLGDWVAEVSSALGLPAGTTVDVAAVLDLARLAAHGVTRPAAPLTTYLAGYAAGLAGGSDVDRRTALDTLIALAGALPKSG